MAYNVLPRERVVKISENVTDVVASQIFIATFPMAAIRKCRLEMGESAMVLGLGILGLLAVQLLRAAGAVPVIAVDPNPDRRQKALQLGADYAFDPFALFRYRRASLSPRIFGRYFDYVEYTCISAVFYCERFQYRFYMVEP